MYEDTWFGGQPVVLLELQSRFEDKTLTFQVFCPQNRTAVLKGPLNLTLFPVMKGTVAPKRPQVPGFPVTPISRCFIGAGNTSLGLELRLVRVHRRATVTS